MGNIQSLSTTSNIISQKSNSGANYYGQWNQIYYCWCPAWFYQTTQIIKKSVPMISKTNQMILSSIRIASLGITQIWHEGRPICHDVIEVWMNCKLCGRNNIVKTLEFSKQGKSQRWGRYQQFKNIQYKESRLSHSEVMTRYKKMKSNGYSLTRYNCQNWASDLWKRL